ncbi:Ni/Fe hydrogenase subunit alpha [Marinobacter caseinilyticus]|uniref:Ni/Fe hydrogenase subunit alpha n=1 Tax=Marinobacter caseinilyticus TaxID=2692195 RepID=UPI001409D455|nr:Ni/Fe hydrogenase subunit alpha [Marinobacter caseinilyticus]
MSRRTISVNYLARVEGEGALRLTIKDGAVRNAELRIFEPPRFFEALLRGRSYTEAPDITARICGICPVAYQMSAVHAIEAAFGLQLDRPLRDLRRLLYCGEWIESHALHIYLLHAPDFLGYAGAVDMGRDHPALLRRGLALKKAGNTVMAQLGGREVHPINVRVGGFYRAPRRRELAPLAETLKRAREDALDTVRWVAGFDFPECDRGYQFVALRHPDEYPMNEGRIVSNRGLDIAAGDYNHHFVESQVRHSTALHSHLRSQEAYLVGPLARYSLNHDRLAPLAREAAAEAGLGTTCHNPFHSIIVRSVEVLHACDEALRLIANYQEPAAPAQTIEPIAGEGCACTEAPRGLLFHRYRLDDQGIIQDVQIVPPTAQNQPSIEADLKVLANDWLDLPDTALRARCEQTVRNYDPCISCATHFLNLEVRHE